VLKTREKSLAIQHGIQRYLRRLCIDLANLDHLVDLSSDSRDAVGDSGSPEIRVVLDLVEDVREG
jgi:hypothetical protein